MAGYEAAETADVDAAVWAQVHQLYGRQSHLIDEGHAPEWAATFTPDGQFHSPSYPAPVIGGAALTAFAQEFYASASASGAVQRHVLTNIAIDVTGADELEVRAYLQIVTTPAGGESRLVRLTTVTDRVVRQGGQWLIASRTVRRDDQRRPR